MKTRHKPLSEYAAEIEHDWTRVYFGARPYLDAMQTLDQIEGCYGLDTARNIVLYFLANSQTWRGETAKRVKKELKDILKNCNMQISDQNHNEVYKK